MSRTRYRIKRPSLIHRGPRPVYRQLCNVDRETLRRFARLASSTRSPMPSLARTTAFSFDAFMLRVSRAPLTAGGTLSHPVNGRCHTRRRALSARPRRLCHLYAARFAHRIIDAFGISSYVPETHVAGAESTTPLGDFERETVNARSSRESSRSQHLHGAAFRGQSVAPDDR